MFHVIFHNTTTIDLNIIIKLKVTNICIKRFFYPLKFSISINTFLIEILSAKHRIKIYLQFESEVRHLNSFFFVVSVVYLVRALQIGRGFEYQGCFGVSLFLIWIIIGRSILVSALTVKS